MNTKNIATLLFVGLLLIPFLIFGQQITPEEGAQTVKYLKGDGDFESWFMEIFTNLDIQIKNLGNDVSRLGRAIGGFGAYIYLGIIGWRMQNGETQWSIEPLLKPFFIGMILIHWTAFTDLIQVPFQKLAEPSKSIFAEIERETNDKRTLRFTKQMQVLDATIKMNAEINAKKAGFWESIGNGEVGQAFSDQWDKLMTPIEEMVEKMNYKGQKLLGEFLETICLLILRVCVYFIFFIQKIWSYILIALGPIAIGISLIPGFDNSIYNWISKFINVNLYTFIAYTIINIGQQLIIAGYQMDISRLSAIVDTNGNVINQNLLITYTTYSGALNSVIFPCVGYLVTAVGILMTPTIANTIVTAGGAGVMTKTKQAAANTANASKSVGKGVASRVGNAARAIGGDASASIKSIKQSINTMRR